jgi:hypothetical protein
VLRTSFSKPGDLPERFAASKHSRKGVQAATDLLQVPLMPVSFVGNRGQRDFFVITDSNLFAGVRVSARNGIRVHFAQRGSA